MLVSEIIDSIPEYEEPYSCADPVVLMVIFIYYLIVFILFVMAIVPLFCVNWTWEKRACISLLSVILSSVMLQSWQCVTLSIVLTLFYAIMIFRQRHMKKEDTDE